MTGYRVAVVGATGAVGTEMLRQLHKRNFPAGEIVPFASERSAGRRLNGATVQALAPERKPNSDCPGHRCWSSACAGIPCPP